MTDGGDLLGKAVVGRVEDAQQLHRHDGVFFDDGDQFLGRAIDIPGQLENALHAFGKGGHSLDSVGKFHAEFGRDFIHNRLCTVTFHSRLCSNNLFWFASYILRRKSAQLLGVSYSLTRSRVR